MEHNFIQRDNLFTLKPNLFVFGLFIQQQNANFRSELESNLKKKTKCA